MKGIIPMACLYHTRLILSSPGRLFFFLPHPPPGFLSRLLYQQTFLGGHLWDSPSAATRGGPHHTSQTGGSPSARGCPASHNRVWPSSFRHPWTALIHWRPPLGSWASDWLPSGGGVRPSGSTCQCLWTPQRPRHAIGHPPSHAPWHNHPGRHVLKHAEEVNLFVAIMF